MPGARLYRSNDVSRFRDDHAILLSGRADDQLKIGGLRVEIAEIETALRSLPGISEAAIVVGTVRQGIPSLVAYVVGGLTLSEERARQHLRDRLPLAMIPGTIHEVASLPRSATGKLDRRRLQHQAMSLNPEPAERPQDPHDARIADLFAEVLGLPSVGLTQDFFAVGGHSLLAMQLLRRLRAQLNLDLGVRAFFDDPTVRGVSAAASPLEASIGLFRVVGVWSILSFGFAASFVVFGASRAWGVGVSHAGGCGAGWGG